MNRKTIIYLSILILLSAVLVFVKSKAHKEKRTDFLNIDSTQVYSFTITSAKDTLKCEKENNEWFVTYPLKYPAEKSTLDNFFMYIVKSKKVAVHENLPMPKLAPRKYVVELFNKDRELMTSFTLQNLSNSNYCVAQFKDEPGYYELVNSLTNYAMPDLFLWRKTLVLDVTKGEINQLQVFMPDRNYTLTKNGEAWIYEESGVKTTIKNFSMRIYKMLNVLENMRTQTFLDNKYEQYSKALDQPILRIRIIKNNSQVIEVKFIKTDNGLIMQKNKETEHLFVLNYEVFSRFEVNLKLLTE